MWVKQMCRAIYEAAVTRVQCGKSVEFFLRRIFKLECEEMPKLRVPKLPASPSQRMKEAHSDIYQPPERTPRMVDRSRQTDEWHQGPCYVRDFNQIWSNIGPKIPEEKLKGNSVTRRLTCAGFLRSLKKLGIQYGNTELEKKAFLFLDNHKQNPKRGEGSYWAIAETLNMLYSNCDIVDSRGKNCDLVVLKQKKGLPPKTKQYVPSCAIGIFPKHLPKTN